MIIDDNCQYWKNLEDMTLSSPNYPKWYYADDVGCEWLISSPEGFIVALEFIHFDVICERAGPYFMFPDSTISFFPN